jgi:exodeoxyribonuclease-5
MGNPNTSELIRLLTEYLEFTPTTDQEKAMAHIAAFELSLQENPVYILKGYAGTGKTSLMSAYVQLRKHKGLSFVLLAPTGRAAKVLALYTRERAYTIHRQIYQFSMGSDGIGKMSNLQRNTVFIVDEASMIGKGGGGDGVFARHDLLSDLIRYVFSNTGNKLLMVGDTAQLPPVGLDISPALETGYLKEGFNVTAYSFEMTQVKRQSLDSGVLLSATTIRDLIRNGNTELPFFAPARFKGDIKRITSGYELEELLVNTFSGRDFDKGIVVCRTNKRANLFNQQIRHRILQFENEIEGGDYLMVVRNNYYWLEASSRAGFIANGDLIRLTRITRIGEMYGFMFADVEVQLLDYPEEKEFSVKILLNTLNADGPGLSNDDRQALTDAVGEDYQDIPERRKRMAEIAKNPWYNALHVKFAYAMTCHKTQGGQWPVVIIDQGYLTDAMISKEYQRWLYTALTRSTDKVYLVNFRDEFFE